MHKAVIVDDEMIIRVGFKSFIDWEDAGFVCCGEASNGIEGLALCRLVRPDVVFTDIVMAKMDGLTFVQNLLTEMPHVKVIVLSCLSDFGMLQSLLRLGVRDYLLKLSFTPQQLLSLLKTLRAELDAEQIAKAPAAEKESYPFTDYLEMQMAYRRLIEKRQNPTALAPGSRLSPEALTGNHALLFYLLRDRFAQGGGQDDDASGASPLVNVLYEMFSADYRCDVCEIRPGALLIVAENTGGQSEESVLENILGVKRNLLRLMRVSVSVGVSFRMQNLSKFYPAFLELGKLYDKRFYEGEGAVLVVGGEAGASATNPAKSKPGWDACEEAINLALTYYDFAAAKEALKVMILEIEARREEDAETVKSGFTMLLALYFRLHRRFRDTVAQEVIEHPQRHIAQMETFESLTAWALSYVDGIAASIESCLKKARVRTEVDAAKRYVQAHAGEPISSRDVAEQLKFNPSYFSFLFKKETGENFSDYLIRTRMQKAMQLLRETQESVEAIAGLVGYSDAAHFRKLFRAQYGKSPNECRNEN